MSAILNVIICKGFSLDKSISLTPNHSSREALNALRICIETLASTSSESPSKMFISTWTIVEQWPVGQVPPLDHWISLV